MKKLVMDLDRTLTDPNDGAGYADKAPNKEVVSALRRYRMQGWEISIYSSRNMRTHAGQIGKINALTLPGIIDWLNKHDIPYDEVHVGKPWCGHDGFYVDDRAVRPDEFVGKTYTEIRTLLGLDAEGA